MATAAAALLSIGMVVANPAPAAATPLGSPENVTATPGRRLIAVAWSVPSAPGGTINRYRATATSSAGTSTCDAAAGVYTCTISSVVANVPYTVSVVACPNAGDNIDCSAPANAANPVTAGPPATPRAPAVEFVDSPTKVRLTWTDNDIGAGIVSYKVTPSSATNLTGTCTALVAFAAKTCDYDNLTPDTPYTFKLTAIGVSNSTGTTGTSLVGPASDPKVAGLPHKMAKPTVARDSDTAVTVSFAKPAGGQALAGYTVNGTSDDGGSPVSCQAGADATDCPVTGLTPAKTYTFTVVARGENAAAGVSPASDPSDSIMPGLPAVPAAPIVELGAAAGQVIVRWEDPDVVSGGVPTSYSVTSEPTDGGSALTDCTGVGPDVRSCNYSNLQDGKFYRFKVTAINSAGSSTSAWSDPVVSQLPAKPTTPTATLGDAPGKVRLTWPAPAGGGPVIYYAVTAIPGGGGTEGTQAPGCGFDLSTPSCEITGLDTSKTYTFTVTAVGDLGTVTSDASASIVPNKPGAATTVAVTRDSPTAATVTWGHPGAGTGGVVASYTVSATPAGGSAVTPCDAVAASSVSCPFTGLDATKSYTFRVTATNASGSTDVTAVPAIPNIPSEPRSPTVTLGATPGDVTVGWTAPLTDVTERYIVRTTSTDQGSLPAQDCVVTAPTTTCPITGLDVTKHYQFTVRAQNFIGGTDAAPTAALVPNLPAAPTDVLVRVTAVGEATVSWSPPDTGGAVATYTVTAATSTGGATLPDGPGRQAGDPCVVDVSANPSATLECVFSTMTSGAEYTFTVRAANPSGGTDFGPTPAVVADVPDAPGNVTAVLGDAPGKVTVNWTDPAGGAVTKYTVTATSSTPMANTPVVCEVIPPAANSCLFTTLTPTASYVFTADAENDLNAGNGTPANPTAALIPNVPDAPTSVTTTLATGTPGALRVNWSAPGGGAVLTGYRVTAVPATVGAFQPPACTVGVTPTYCDFSGLTTSETYTFDVEALNTAGYSTKASSPSVVPNKPNPATNLVVTLATDTPGSATVTWGAPDGGAAVTGYTVSATGTNSAATPTPCSVGPSATKTCTLNGMTTTEAYTFKVRATNASGDTDVTSSPIKPNAAGMPTGVTATLGEVPGKVIVTWLEPTNLGPALTYTVTPASGSGFVPSACTKTAAEERSCVFTGLTTTASYTFTVRAANPSGGADALATPALKPDKPGLPTSVVATQGNAVGKATVNWVGPTDLGAPETYTVTATPASGAPETCTKTEAETKSCTFTDLDPSQLYTFTVKAANPSGDSVETAVQTFIPDRPAKPTDVTVTLDALPGQATVTWVQPEGAAVTGWTVTATSPDGGTPPAPCTKGPSDEKSCPFTGLTPTASYSFRVQASNVAGDILSDPTGPMVPNRPNPPGPPFAEPIAGDLARISWMPPFGGGQVDKYTVTAYAESAPTDPISSVPCTEVVENTCEFDALSEAELYRFKVTAIGPGGSATSEASFPITTAGPGMPGLPTVELAGPGAVRVSWNPPETGGPVMSYSVVSDPDLSAPARCTNVKVLSCVFDRLTSGTPYMFMVSAAGTGGRETMSERSMTIVPGPPGAPEQVTVEPTADPTQVQVRWQEPPPGAEVIGYVVESDPGQFGCTGPVGAEARSCLVPGLNPQTQYSFRVRAVGAAGGGDSPFSPPTWEITPGAPLPPGDAEVAAGNGQVAVSWAAPKDFADRVDHFRAETGNGEHFCETAGSADTECVITGLQNLTTYEVTVIAVGKDGTLSQPSWPGIRVRPTAGAPGMPTEVLAASRDAGALVTWRAPALAGDGIARYQVTAVREGEQRSCFTTGALSCTVQGLTNGQQYTVTVVAIGKAASGYSPPSAPVTVTPRVPPGVPANVQVTSAVRSLVVSWTPNGVGDGLAGFTASTGGGTPQTCTIAGATATTCTILNLNPGDYTVSVVANGTQAGIVSAPSTPVPGKALLALAPTLSTTLMTTSNLLTVSATTVKQGGTVLVSGTGFAPHTGISLGIYSSLVRLGTVATDGSGSFTTEVTIPNTVTVGTGKTLIAGGLPVGSSTLRYAKAMLTVTAP